MQSLLFRKDIQGLRGIAIFFVLIFHFYPDIFPKGFLGVDLFFVISGYLLTFIYFKKKTSHFVFFSRRVKRLLIPILAITFFSILLATFLLLPIDLSNFWNSVLTTVFFASNFYFLLTGGYFGGINELKPFIHMWSLAMEMQFYFVYTILLLLIGKYFNKNYFFFIFFLTCASFFLYLFLLSYEKNELAFFLLPTRLWEFLFGSIIYFTPTIKIHKRLNYIIYVFAIFIIFILVAAYKLQITDLTRQFLVVFFVGLVIYAGTKIKNDNLLLGNFFFQFL
jgi:peptidoglycan/LPS O-acetylase OafA/YrhL